MKDDRILRIYTDGACSGNQSAQNFGGWGAILEFAGHSKELYGGEKNTTNNRMEMTAREFDTSFSIAKTRHIEITPLAVNFFVKFYDFVSACWCLL